MTDRRAWERFVKDLKKGVSLAMPVTSQKEIFCSSCFSPVAPVKAEDCTIEGDIRESHATALGKVQVEVQWVSKGIVTEKVKESKRAKDHY